jgi:chitinase
VTTSCTATAPPTTPPASSCAAWLAATAYSAGATVTEGCSTYKANWWTQGDDPATHSGVAASGQPWTTTTSCAATPPSSPPSSPPWSPPSSGFVFGSYKDVTINMDWNVDQISTSVTVTGTRSPVLNVMPAKQTSMTWAFASGECGSENWAGVTPAALVAQNV